MAVSAITPPAVTGARVMTDGSFSTLESDDRSMAFYIRRQMYRFLCRLADVSLSISDDGGMAFDFG